MATIKINTGLTKEQTEKMIRTITETLEGYNPDATDEAKERLFNDFMVTQFGQWVANIVKQRINKELNEVLNERVSEELEGYGFKKGEKPVS
jgi:DNA polymerase III alpha subunit (gram-positive type)